MSSNLALTGQSTEHLVQLDQSDFFIHKEASKAFVQLRKSCLERGVDLQILSSFRSFEAQSRIWNAKATGDRVLLDSDSNILNYRELGQEEILFAILRWSALPGLSRHHWGTDIDIVDAQILRKNPEYQVDLIPSEYEAGGIFENLTKQLNDLIANDQSQGFFRPYQHDLGGVSPELWHLSYAPVSNHYMKKMSFEKFNEILQTDEMKELELYDLILKNKDEIYHKYIVNISL